MATAHLGCCVRIIRPSIHNFSAKLDHARVIPQVWEQEPWPVTNQYTGSEFKPPIPMLRILHKEIHIIIILFVNIQKSSLIATHVHGYENDKKGKVMKD